MSIVRIDQKQLDAHIVEINAGSVRIYDLGTDGVLFELYTDRSGHGEGIGYYTRNAFHCWDETIVNALKNLASSAQAAHSERSGT